MPTAKKIELTEFCQLKVKLGFDRACEIFRENIHRQQLAAENPHVVYPLEIYSLSDTPQDKMTRERCQNCYEEIACLHFAIEVQLPNHVYGGLNHQERAALEVRFLELFGPDAPPIESDMELSRRESEYWHLLEAQTKVSRIS
jgi:hypothetical protein